MNDLNQFVPTRIGIRYRAPRDPVYFARPSRSKHGPRYVPVNKRAVGREFRRWRRNGGTA